MYYGSDIFRAKVQAKIHFVRKYHIKHHDKNNVQSEYNILKTF